MKRNWRRVFGGLGFGLVQGCMLLGHDVGPVSIQAYRCAESGQAICQVAGELIPEGTLPPTDEAFLVVARYQGTVSRWALIFASKTRSGAMDSTVLQIGLQDSASVWINLMGAKDGYYKERVGADGSMPDSLTWEYGWRRSTAPAINVQAAVVGASR